MSYEIITVYEVYQMDTGNMYYEKHIGYYVSNKEAKDAAGTHYDVSPRAAIRVGNDIWLLANGVGHNHPIEVKRDAVY